MQDLVSVIIPIYKAEKYLPECLDSVVHQTYEHLEILLIDDGSPDDSGKICDAYAQQDARIKVIHKENGGVSAARNTGLDAAQGAYIAFIDSDDRVPAEYIEKLHNKISAEGADICLCHFLTFSGERTVEVEESLPSCLQIDLDEKQTREFFYKYLSTHGIAGVPWRSLYSRRAIAACRFHCNIMRMEDLLFNLEVLMNCKKVVSLPECLYEYRMNESSQMNTYNHKLLQNYVNLYEQMSALFSRFRDAQTEKKLKTFFCLLCYACFTNELKGRKGRRIGKDTYKQKVREIRKSELYPYLTIRNGMRFDDTGSRAKFLLVWALAKMRL